MWSSARLPYESVAVAEGRNKEPLCEEKLIVFLADQDEEIIDKVTALAERDESNTTICSGTRFAGFSAKSSRFRRS